MLHHHVSFHFQIFAFTPNHHLTMVVFIASFVQNTLIEFHEGIRSKQTIPRNTVIVVNLMNRCLHVILGTYLVTALKHTGNRQGNRKLRVTCSLPECQGGIITVAFRIEQFVKKITCRQ